MGLGVTARHDVTFCLQNEYGVESVLVNWCKQDFKSHTL